MNAYKIIRVYMNDMPENVYSLADARHYMESLNIDTEKVWRGSDGTGAYWEWYDHEIDETNHPVPKPLKELIGD